MLYRRFRGDGGRGRNQTAQGVAHASKGRAVVPRVARQKLRNAMGEEGRRWGGERGDGGSSKDAAQGLEDDALKMALARIRQLSAHEIGHTLGFAHNFTSSANGRKSVMDYPHPNIELIHKHRLESYHCCPTYV